MRIWIFAVALFFVLAIPGKATEFTAPLPPEDVQALMPVETESFVQGLWEILTNAFSKINPEVSQSALSCLGVFAVVMLISVLKSLPGGSGDTVELAGVIAVAMALLQQTNSMIHLGVRTVRQLSDYGKLLVPVLTTATAAQGQTVTSAALYTGTTVFNAVLLSLITKLLTPMIYVFLAMSVADGAAGMKTVQNVRNFVTWLMTWSLKILLDIFTGYMGITKVVSGSTDAAKLKAAKLTISGMVPVVGNMMADASETILVSAGLVKSAVGIYGLLAIIATALVPSLTVALRYLLLKATAAAASVLGGKEDAALIGDFGAAMGLLLAMTMSQSLLLLISTVCFMKGMG